MEIYTDPYSIFFNAKNYITWFLDNKGVVINAVGDLQSKSRWQSADSLLHELTCQYGEDFTKLKASFRSTKTFFPFNKFSAEEMKSGLSLAITEKRLSAFNAIRDSLVGPESTTVDEWVQATIDNPTPADVAAYKHFIWQVKRKLFELPVSYHMMLNIMGPQGVGKTESTRRLLAPLQELVTERPLSELADERNAYLLGLVGVVLIEELAGASRTDIDHLKGLMSKDKVQARVLGHNRHINTFQNATLVSTSNQSIAEMVMDSTGMRRFYELKFRTDKNWEALNKLNPIDVWRSVDHLRDPYIIPHLEHIAQKQNTYIRQSILQAFLETNNYELTNEPGVPYADFWEHVREFADKMQKGFSFDASKLHHELKRLFDDKVKVYRTSGSPKSYNLKMVRTNSTITEELRRKVLGG